MKTTKKLACLMVTFAVVVMTDSPARADYSTTRLVATSDVDVTCSANAGPCAVIIYRLKEGNVADVEVLLNPTGPRSIPRSAVRVMFEADIAHGAQGVLRISQGGVPLDEPPLGGLAPHERRIVFDIAH